MLDAHSVWKKECAEREPREVCHQKFWCDSHRAHAINRSSRGMCFRIACRTQPGVVVRLHLGPSLMVKARVAWTRRLDDNCTEVGVEFLSEKKTLEPWLAHLKEEPQPEGKEPILALPAPGQTFSNGSSGVAWQLAMRYK